MLSLHGVDTVVGVSIPQKLNKHIPLCSVMTQLSHSALLQNIMASKSNLHPPPIAQYRPSNQYLLLPWQTEAELLMWPISALLYLSLFSARVCVFSRSEYGTATINIVPLATAWRLDGCMVTDGQAAKQWALATVT